MKRTFAATSPSSSDSSYQPEETVTAQPADNFHAPGIRLPPLIGKAPAATCAHSMSCPDRLPLSNIYETKIESVCFGDGVATVAVVFVVVLFVRHGL